jgi:hypothetical protein
VSGRDVNEAGYRSFTLGSFSFTRDEYFVEIQWPTAKHRLSADTFLRALMRDVACGFFYGTVNFDEIFGTVNHYGTVDVFAGSFNPSLQRVGTAHTESFQSEIAPGVFGEILSDWTNEGYDPFAAPGETGSAFGKARGDNLEAINRNRVTAQRMVGVPNDEAIRKDDPKFPINRMFADVDQSEPEIDPEPGYESEVCAFNLIAYLSRSNVIWNPSVVSVCKDSLACPTTEEYILPIIHGNDRIEWFVQLSVEIHWNVEDRDTGELKARVTVKPGDAAAMPADIRHQGFGPKRAMLLV